jgi:MinD superfamily P-loop ATPase
MKIAIASGKGGTGKTMISVNLAAFCSQEAKTLLVDLDVEEPNDAIFIKGLPGLVREQFKMIPEWDEKRCTLCNICSTSCKFHAVVRLGTYIGVFKELCHSCYACSELCPANALPMKQHKMGVLSEFFSGNLTFLESRLEIGEEQAVPLIKKTYDLVNQHYPNIPIQIFDCPPGTSCPVVAATRQADFVLLVTEPTPFGLNDLRLAAETMKTLNKPIGVVINRDGMGDSEVENYCMQEHIPVVARIPFSREIAGYYSKGELVIDKIPGLDAVFQTMMDYIKGRVGAHD